MCRKLCRRFDGSGKAGQRFRHGGLRFSCPASMKHGGSSARPCRDGGVFDGQGRYRIPGMGWIRMLQKHRRKGREAEQSLRIEKGGNNRCCLRSHRHRPFEFFELTSIQARTKSRPWTASSIALIVRLPAFCFRTMPPRLAAVTRFSGNNGRMFLPDGRNCFFVSKNRKRARNKNALE